MLLFVQSGGGGGRIAAKVMNSESAAEPHMARPYIPQSLHRISMRPAVAFQASNP